MALELAKREALGRLLSVIEEFNRLVDVNQGLSLQRPMDWIQFGSIENEYRLKNPKKYDLDHKYEKKMHLGINQLFFPAFGAAEEA